MSKEQTPEDKLREAADKTKKLDHFGFEIIGFNEAKTNEDFNKKTPQKDDPMLKVKQVKK